MKLDKPACDLPWIEAFLHSVPIFQDLSTEAISCLARNSRQEDYQKGVVICETGSEANYVYLLITGAVSEFACDPYQFSMQVNLHHPGAHFGEMGVLLEEAYSTSLITTEPSRLLLIPASVFSQIMWENPSALKQVIRWFRTALQYSFQKHISCVMFNAEGRLAYAILMFNRETGQTGVIPLSQESLAYRCGLSRQTISSVLAKWKSAGVIQVSRCAIHILNEAALTDILLACSQQA